MKEFSGSHRTPHRPFRSRLGLRAPMALLQRSRLARTIAMALAVAFTGGTVAVATAPAANAGYIAVYSVNMQQACQEKNWLGASYYNYWSAYSWYCYIPAWQAPGFRSGPVDIQAWCTRHHPGTRAVVVVNDITGWRCWWDSSWGVRLG